MSHKKNNEAKEKIMWLWNNSLFRGKISKPKRRIFPLPKKVIAPCKCEVIDSINFTCRKYLDGYIKYQLSVFEDQDIAQKMRQIIIAKLLLSDKITCLTKWQNHLYSRFYHLFSQSSPGLPWLQGTRQQSCYTGGTLGVYTTYSSRHFVT